MSTSAWFDNWCEAGPLCSIIAPRILYNAGFLRKDKVSDLIANGVWKWPVAWLDLFPVLNNTLTMTLRADKQDVVKWKVSDKLYDFSVSIAWESFRVKYPTVRWYEFVWFAMCVPRHAFMVWLVVRGKLLTQDKIISWGLDRRKNMNMMCCLLCYRNIDSHAHLFFECGYSSLVWKHVRARSIARDVEPIWDNIIDFFDGKQKFSMDVVSAKLIVHAAVYYIWQERNNRIFSNLARSSDVLAKSIIQCVRDRLLGIRPKVVSCSYLMRAILDDQDDSNDQINAT